ncbi:winged helix-turn-helix transcriptional regulator [Pirellulaceae bacterium SH449]
MKKPKHKRSPCPVACTLDLIGDKWTLLIVRDMLFGRCYYKDFCQSPERIATNILADRLGKLVESGIAEKWIPDEENGREAYRLTAKGQSLKTVLESVAQWGLDNIKGTEARLKTKSK